MRAVCVCFSPFGLLKATLSPVAVSQRVGPFELASFVDRILTQMSVGVQTVLNVAAQHEAGMMVFKNGRIDKDLSNTLTAGALVLPRGNVVDSYW